MKIGKLFTGFKEKPNTMTLDEVEAAMCLWEEVVNNLESYPGLADIDGGTPALRWSVMELAKECDKAYNDLDEDDPMRNEPFDWEFVPRWLSERYS